MGTIATLAIGAFGAIIAIFLKEAVQAAMQRRVIAWQLFGYLMSWKSQIVKDGKSVAIYNLITERNQALTKAAGRDTSEFQRVHAEQHKERAELREKVKAALIEAFSKTDLKGLTDNLVATLLSKGADSLSEQRRLLADSKSFISDRDAAILGKACAMNVVQFRTSLINLLICIEGIFKLLPHESEARPQIVAGLVDQTILFGEELFIAMIRLEKNVESVSKKSLFVLAMDILQGR